MAYNKYGIDTDRFVQYSGVEFELTQWNKSTYFEVWRDRHNHEVAVVYYSRVIWDWYVAIVAAIDVLFMLIMLVITPLSVVNLLLMGLVFLLIGVGLIMFERTVVKDYIGDTPTCVIMDTPVWEMIKSRVLHQTKGVDFEDKPLSPVSRMVSTVKKDKDVLDPTEGLALMCSYLDTQSQKDYHKKLYAKYMHNFDLAYTQGRGMRGCGCQACRVMRQKNIVPDVTGLEATQHYKALRSKYTTTSDYIQMVKNKFSRKK